MCIPKNVKWLKRMEFRLLGFWQSHVHPCGGRRYTKDLISACSERILQSCIL